MRLLPERADHDRKGAAGQELESLGRADPRGNGEDPVPVYDVLPRAACHQAGGEKDCRAGIAFGEGGNGMRTSRRTFLKSAGGFLLVGYSRGGASLGTVLQADGFYWGPGFKQLHSWVVIYQDNTATVYVRKTDLLP